MCAWARTGGREGKRVHYINIINIIYTCLPAPAGRPSTARVRVCPPLTARLSHPYYMKQVRRSATNYWHGSHYDQRRMLKRQARGLPHKPRNLGAQAQAQPQVGGGMME